MQLKKKTASVVKLSCHPRCSLKSKIPTKFRSHHRTCRACTQKADDSHGNRSHPRSAQRDRVPAKHTGSRITTKAWCEAGQLQESHQRCQTEGNLVYARPSAPVFLGHSPGKAMCRMGKGLAGSKSLAQACKHRDEKRKAPSFDNSAAALLSGLAPPEHKSNDPSSKPAHARAAAPLLTAAIQPALQKLMRERRKQGGK